MKIRKDSVFGKEQSTAAISALTLDQLVRNIMRRNPDGLFLADPPNLIDVTGGATSRRYTWREADERIQTIADSLLSIGLRQDEIVAIRMPNTTDLLLTMCGIWRAGLIACPLPLTWRRREWVNALSLVAPKALLTTTQIGKENAAETACEMAAKQFSIRFVGAFGGECPDGVINLDELMDQLASETEQSTAPASPELREGSGDHVATLHFMETNEGISAVPRCHASWVANALRIVTDTGLTQFDTILTPMMQSHSAGFVSGMVASLLSGAALHLHHPFSAQTLSEQLREEKPSILVGNPTFINAAMAVEGFAKPRWAVNIVPFGTPGSIPALPPGARTVTYASFGEMAVLPATPEADGGVSIRSGVFRVNENDPSSPEIIKISPVEGGSKVEKSSDAATIVALNGRAAPDGNWTGPTQAFGSRNDTKSDSRNDQLFMLPLLFEKREGDTLTPKSFMPGMTALGGLLIDLRALDRVFSRIKGAEAAAVALDDAAVSVGIVPEGAQSFEPSKVWASLSELAIADHKIPERVASFVSLPRLADGGIDRDLITKKAAAGS